MNRTKHSFGAHKFLEKSTFYMLDASEEHFLKGRAKTNGRRTRAVAMRYTISTYERTINDANQTITFEQSEKHNLSRSIGIYGSSRLGVMNTKIPMLGSQNSTYSQATWTHTIGEKTFEISNHLGNVLAVISDKPIPNDFSGAGNITHYLADIRHSSDYSPFGVTLEGRDFALAGAEGYRYGFNGKEKDNEIKTFEGSSYDFGARMYDPRVGRWLSVDALEAEYPSISPYVFVTNSPLMHIDPDGDRVIVPMHLNGGFRGWLRVRTEIMFRRANDPVFRAQFANDRRDNNLHVWRSTTMSGANNHPTASYTNPDVQAISNGAIAHNKRYSRIMNTLNRRAVRNGNNAPTANYEFRPIDYVTGATQTSQGLPSGSGTDINTYSLGGIVISNVTLTGNNFAVADRVDVTANGNQNVVIFSTTGQTGSDGRGAIPFNYTSGTMTPPASTTSITVGVNQDMTASPPNTQFNYTINLSGTTNRVATTTKEARKLARSARRSGSTVTFQRP